MSKLSKQDFAQLVREMPDASDEEILAEARKREASADEGVLAKVWNTVRTPLTDLPSRAGKAVGDFIENAPSSDESFNLALQSLPGIGSAFKQMLGEHAGAKAKGFVAGSAEGTGDVLTQMTSPLDLALTATGVGGAVSRTARTAQNLRNAERAFTAPLVAEGAYNVGEGAIEGDFGKVGAGSLQALVGGAGMRPGRPAVKQSSPAAPPAAAAPQPTAHPSSAASAAAPDVPSVQRMPGDVPPEFHAVLDSFSDPKKFVDPQSSPLLNEDYGIVTWANPGKTLSPAENVQRNAELAKLLKQEGYNPINQKGVFDGEEPSFLVPGLTADQAKRIGRMGDQVSVISRDGYHRLADDATFPNQGIQFDQAADNYYSVVELPGQGPVKYQMQFPDEAFGPPAAIETPKAPAPALQGLGDATAGTEQLSSPLPQGSTAAAKEATYNRIVDKLPDPAEKLGSGANKQLADAMTKVADAKAKKSGGGTAALAIAAPAASMAIPDDPDSKWDDYGRIGLGLAGAVGLGAAVRAQPLTGQKLFAARGAGLMLAGVPKQAMADRLVQAGVAEDQIPKILAASKKMLEKEVQKAGAKLTATKKLVSFFHGGKGDMKWYDETHKELQELFGKDADKMAGFLTATSVNATVKSNVTLALKAYQQWKTGEPFKGYLPAVIKELDRVAKDQPLAGRKLDNFRRALTGDPDAVVVDRWMLRAFGFTGDKGATPHTYDLIENAVKELAQQQGVTPRQMQAAMWFSVKNAAEAKRGVRNPAPPFQQILREKMAQLPLFKQ